MKVIGVTLGQSWIMSAFLVQLLIVPPFTFTSEIIIPLWMVIYRDTLS